MNIFIKKYRKKSPQATPGGRTLGSDYSDKQIPLSDLRTNNIPQATSVLRTSDVIAPKDRIPLLDSRTGNTIPEYISKNNLPEWLNPKASTAVTSAIENYVDKANSQNLPDIRTEKPLELRIEKQIYPNGKEIDIEYPTNDLPKSYKKDLTGYTNPLTGGNRIYTAEDIGEFTKEEFAKLEPEIDAQMNKIGIPRNDDLGVFSGGTIYIAPYTRSDGTRVKGHYRSR